MTKKERLVARAKEEGNDFGPFAPDTEAQFAQAMVLRHRNKVHILWGKGLHPSNTDVKQKS